MTRLLSAAAAALLLAACVGTPPPVVPAAASWPTPAETVAGVRVAGQDGVELVVRPLIDPHVEDLRVRAAEAEALGRLADADTVLRKALEITADDPDLLQWRAEVALLRGQPAEAERLATRSAVLGPKSGPLCRRNWALKKALREQRGETLNAASAQAMLEACTIAPPVRM